MLMVKKVEILKQLNTFPQDNQDFIFPELCLAVLVREGTVTQCCFSVFFFYLPLQVAAVVCVDLFFSVIESSCQKTQKKKNK